MIGAICASVAAVAFDVLVIVAERRGIIEGDSGNGTALLAFWVGTPAIVIAVASVFRTAPALLVVAGCIAAWVCGWLMEWDSSGGHPTETGAGFLGLFIGLPVVAVAVASWIREVLADMTRELGERQPDKGWIDTQRSGHPRGAAAPRLRSPRRGARGKRSGQ